MKIIILSLGNYLNPLTKSHWLKSDDLKKGLNSVVDTISIPFVSTSS